MSPENNSSTNNSSNVSDNSIDKMPGQGQSNGAEIQPSPTPATAVTTPQPVVNPTSNDHGAPSAPHADPMKSPKSKSSVLKVVLIFLVILLALAGVAYAAYKYGYGKGKKVVVAQPVTAPKPITLPPQAVVTSECTPGRGKQYIIPKDIPVGPIYDVVNNRVIAIEYVLGIKALFTNSDTFSTAILSLSKNYSVDHFTLVPGTPQPGDTDQYIHLVMFVVTKDVANAITCSSTSGSGGSNSSSSSSQSTTSTTGSTTTTQ